MNPSMGIPKQTLLRLPIYLRLLRQLPAEKDAHISATAIAELLGLNQVQVRKDLSMISDGGKPRTGYLVRQLVFDLEHFLGYDDMNSVVLVGAGHLGQAILHYDGFSDYGLDILAGFDISCHEEREESNGKFIFPMERLSSFCRRTNAHIGILTVPAEHAQQGCDALVAAGVRAIWNFTPVRLQVPPGILVQNEDLAASLALLSQRLKENWMSGNQTGSSL